MLRIFNPTVEILGAKTWGESDHTDMFETLNSSYFGNTKQCLFRKAKGSFESLQITFSAVSYQWYKTFIATDKKMNIKDAFWLSDKPNLGQKVWISLSDTTSNITNSNMNLQWSPVRILFFLKINLNCYKAHVQKVLMSLIKSCQYSFNKLS